MEPSSRGVGGGAKKRSKAYKLLTIGSMATGKTSILKQFVYHTFDPRATQATIGCDFWHRNLTLTGDFDSSPSAITSAASQNSNNNNNSSTGGGGGKNNNTISNNNNSSRLDVQIQVWDTAGMEQFQSLASSFFRGADGALLVYDLTNPDSFEHARTWRDMFITHAGATAPILLVGNKIDLKEERKVPPGSGENFVAESAATQKEQFLQQQQQQQMDASSSSSSSLGASANSAPCSVIGAIELTAGDSEAVEKAFITLTYAMLEREKTKAIQSGSPMGDGVVSASDLKRVRLGSMPPAVGGEQKESKCKC